MTQDEKVREYVFEYELGSQYETQAHEFYVRHTLSDYGGPLRRVVNRRHRDGFEALYVTLASPDFGDLSLTPTFYELQAFVEGEFRGRCAPANNEGAT